MVSNSVAPIRARPEDLLAGVTRLSADAYRLLEVAALFAEAFAIDDVADVLGEPVGRVVPALRETLAAGVVVTSDDLLAFRNGAVRDTIDAGIPEPIRLALHRQIGAVLVRRGCAASAAEHLMEGRRPGDREALSDIDRAAHQMIATEPQAAADLAVRVLELTTVTDDAKLSRTVTAVDALLAARRVGEAKSFARAALTCPRRGSLDAARLRATLSSILLMSGQPAHAVAEAEAVLAEPDLPDDLADAAEVARLLGLLAQNDPVRAQAVAEAILAGGERPGRDAPLACALSALAIAAGDQGRVALGLGLLRAAVRRADLGWARDQHPRFGLAILLIALGDFAEAETVGHQVTDEIERTHDVLWEPAPPLLNARLHLAAGRLDQAAAQVRVALVTARDLGTRLWVPPALATATLIALYRGDLEKAAHYIERYHAEPAPPQARLDVASYTWAQARLTEAQKGPYAAMDLLAGLYEALPGQPALLVEEPASAAWLTRVALAARKPERAETVVICAEFLAASNPGFSSLLAAATHARGLRDRDVPLLEKAETTYRHPLVTASAAEDAGVVLAHDGDHHAARDAFERALTSYQDAGAERDAARLRSRLRREGVRHRHWHPAERPASGWPSLTEAEHRVADVVAEGLTNAQVGDRMFLSRHTVDFHLRQIFRKLGIRSRVELTRLVLEHEDPRDGA